MGKSAKASGRQRQWVPTVWLRRAGGRWISASLPPAISWVAARGSRTAPEQAAGLGWICRPLQPVEKRRSKQGGNTGAWEPWDGKTAKIVQFSKSEAQNPKCETCHKAQGRTRTIHQPRILFLYFACFVVSLPLPETPKHPEGAESRQSTQPLVVTGINQPPRFELRVQEPHSK